MKGKDAEKERWRLACHVTRLYGVPVEHLKQLHLVYALFMGKKVIGSKKFSCAYVRQQEEDDSFVPVDQIKARVVFDSVEIEEGLLLVCSVIISTKKGKQVLSSLAINICETAMKQHSIDNTEMDFAPSGKGCIVVNIDKAEVEGIGETKSPSGNVINSNCDHMEPERNKLDPNDSSRANEEQRKTISTISNVPMECWDETSSGRSHRSNNNSNNTSDIYPKKDDDKVPPTRSNMRPNGSMGGLLPLEQGFLGAGSSPGMRCWKMVVESSGSGGARSRRDRWSNAAVQEMKFEDIGHFDSHECYVLLNTLNRPEENQGDAWSLHTWIGELADMEKAHVAGFKAQMLARSIHRDISVVKNLEGEESDELLELCPSFHVEHTVSGTETKSDSVHLEGIASSTKNSQCNNDSNDNANGTLEVCCSDGDESSNGATSQSNWVDVEGEGNQFSERNNENGNSNISLSLDSSTDNNEKNLMDNAIPSSRKAKNYRKRGDSFIATENMRYSLLGSSSSSSSDEFPDGSSSNIDAAPSPVLDPKCAFSMSMDAYDDNDSDDNVDGELETCSVGDNSCELQRYMSSFDSEEVRAEISDRAYFSDDSVDEYSLSATSPKHSSVSPFKSPPRQSEVLGSDERLWQFEMTAVEDYCSQQIEAHDTLRKTHHSKMAQSSTKTVLSYSPPRVSPKSSLRKKVKSPSKILKKGSTKSNARSSPSNSIDFSQVNMYRIGYIQEKLHVSRVAGLSSDDVDYGHPSRFTLQQKGVFILDLPDKVYLWTGMKSNPQLRSAGETFAKALVQHSREEEVAVETVLEGEECNHFKEHFPDWRDWEQRRRKSRKEKSGSSNVPPIGDVKQAGKASSLKSTPLTAHSKHDRNNNNNNNNSNISSNIDISGEKPARRPSLCKAVQEEEVETSLDERLAMDNGNGVTAVWKIEDRDFVRISDAEMGHFWVQETYVVLYGFTSEKSGKAMEDRDRVSSPCFVVYFWQGPHSKPSSYTQWVLNIFPQKKVEWMSTLGTVPSEVRVEQGKEPVHFFKIFRGSYCVHFPFVELLEENKMKEKSIRSQQVDILSREKQRELERLKRNPEEVGGRCSSPTRPKRVNGLISERKVAGHDPMTVTVGDSTFVMESSAGILLFHVRGHGVHEADVHAVQIEARTCRLISSDCFIALRPMRDGKSTVWLWVGKGTQYSEQVTAGALAQKLKQWFKPNGDCSLRVIEEGVIEWVNRWAAKAFYRSLGGMDIYTNPKMLSIPRDERPVELRYPTMFVCDLIKDGDCSVRMLKRFSQADLLSSGAAILDAHFAVFLWRGRSCTAALAEVAMSVAKRFLGTMRKSHTLLERKVIAIDQYKEVISFVSCFHGWVNWEMLEKTFVDPWRVRCDVRSSLGLTGEHRLGRVTTSKPPAKLQKKPSKAPKTKTTDVRIRSRLRAATKSFLAKKTTKAQSPKAESQKKSPKSNGVSVAQWSIKSPSRDLFEEKSPDSAESSSPGHCPSGASCSRSEQCSHQQVVLKKPLHQPVSPRKKLSSPNSKARKGLRATALRTPPHLKHLQEEEASGAAGGASSQSSPGFGAFFSPLASSDQFKSKFAPTSP